MMNFDILVWLPEQVSSGVVLRLSVLYRKAGNAIAVTMVLGEEL